MLAPCEVIVAIKFPKLKFPEWLGLPLIILWILSGFMSCSSVEYRGTAKSVHVSSSSTSNNGYYRRPPGMAKSDNLRNKKLLWARYSIFLLMVTGFVYRIRKCPEDPDTIAQREAAQAEVEDDDDASSPLTF